MSKVSTNILLYRRAVKITVSDKEKIKKAAEMIKNSRYAVCLTGAGVSTDSGIQDFRTPGKGLWSKVDPMEVTSIQAFQENPARFYQFYRSRIEELQYVSPNKAHISLDNLEEAGYLKFLITQNIDGLHQKAGSRRVLEIHGNLNQAICYKCGKRISSQLLLKKLDENSDKVPYCRCGSVFKPDVVLFGETLCELDQAIDEASKADLFLVAGSSLQVSPANMLPEYSLAHKGSLIIINYMNTHLDNNADLVVHQNIGEFLSEVCKYLNII